jgi:hypothetical protein
MAANAGSLKNNNNKRSKQARRQQIEAAEIRFEVRSRLSKNRPKEEGRPYAGNTYIYSM